MDLLFGEPVIKLKGDEFLSKPGYTFAQQVEEYFKSQGGIANSPLGEVILDSKSVQNSKQHGMSRIKAVAFAAVKDVLEKGVKILDLDYYGKDKPQRTGMIAAPIQIGKEKYVCVVEVIDNLKDQRLYVHEAFLGKTLQGAVASSLVHGGTATSPHPNGEVAKVLHNYLNTYSDLSFLTKNGTFSALRDRKNAENNKDNGWGNATQAEINWWKNKNIGENKQYTNMNKKLIRLTEGDLNRIVKESVNKVLTELDWKTYRNASRYPNKDSHVIYGGRKDEFAAAARKAFNKKYGFVSPTARFSCGHASGNVMEPNLEINPYGKYNIWYPVYKEARGYYLVKGNQWNVNDNYSKIDLSDYMSDEEIIKYENGMADWEHYIANNNDSAFSPSNDGDYEYQKEKGWQLKH